MYRIIVFLASLFGVYSKIIFYEEYSELNPWELSSVQTKLFPSESIQHFTIKTWANSGIYYNCSMKLNRHRRCENFFISIRSMNEDKTQLYNCFIGNFEGYAHTGMEIVAKIPRNGVKKSNNDNLEGMSCDIHSRVRGKHDYELEPPQVRFYEQNVVDDDSSEYGLNKVNTPKQTTCSCGAANRGKPNMRIVNGTQYHPNKYPFLIHTQIEDDNGDFTQWCGGVLISPKIVLTAAHCTDGALINNKRYRIIAGAHNRNDLMPNSQIRDVSQIIQHELFTMENHHFYDISILILKNALNLNQFVSPVCMPTPGLDIIGKQVNALGWGQTSSTSDMTEIPFYTKLNVLDRLDCSTTFDVPYDFPSHLCTYNSQQNVCMGDSGGPFVWVDPETNKYTLVGLTSFGTAECDLSYPTVQTEVTAYLDWIKKKLTEYNVTESYCTRDDGN